MFHKMRQVLHECVIVYKCESTFTQFHRVIKTCQKDTKQLVGHLIGNTYSRNVFLNISYHCNSGYPVKNERDDKLYHQNYGHG